MEYTSLAARERRKIGLEEQAVSRAADGMAGVVVAALGDTICRAFELERAVWFEACTNEYT